MDERGNVELIAAIESRYPDEWLGIVIPPGEDEEHPERGLLVVHSFDDNEVWDAVDRVTHNQVVHTYYNGVLNEQYLAWAHSDPAPVGDRIPAQDQEMPWLKNGRLVPVTIEC
ncbi:MAG: hypothetical protein NVS4B8_25240 [Herpetosiphon sp.]